MPIPNFRSLTQLVNKTVVIFGGSSGVRFTKRLPLVSTNLAAQIGYEVAKASLEHGAKVIIASSRAEKVAAAVQALSEAHESFKGKISGSTCSAKDEEKFWDGVGKFDHLVRLSLLVPSRAKLTANEGVYGRRRPAHTILRINY